MFPAWAAVLASALIGATPTAAVGQFTHAGSPHVADPENCLSCHRFRGLSRFDAASGEVRLFSCSVEYTAYQQGPHARLRCTDCHKREEVTVIPHRVETKVDCTRTCHLQSATGVAVDFTHARIAEKLGHSAHSSQALRNLKLTEPLLRPGQSECLYCHDEPLFREPHNNLIRVRAGEPEARCDTCHAQTLPLDTAYFTQHVLSRLQPARSVRPQAQTCAVCHSDPEVIQQIGSHDAVASYLHSFHGKASLLGSAETATCVDCHRSTFGDVHLMLGASDPQSSVHPERLATTCRTTECHPSAPPAMVTAAVHLDLNPQNRTPEYYLAAAFILLTAGVMVIYFVLIILELLNTVLGRHDPDHHRLCTLARKLQAIPEVRSRLMRMSLHERWQHWALVIFFSLLVVTGMPMKFAESNWAESTISWFGNLTIARWVHRVSGVLLLVAFAYHIAYLSVALMRRMRDARQRDPSTTLWQVLISGPMVVKPVDVRQFGQLFAFLLFLRPTRPDFPRYNFMQKFEYWAVFWGTPVLGLSGLVLWRASSVTEYLSGRVLNFAFIIHTLEAYLAFIHVAVVHMISVMLGPAVFPLSLGTFTGQAPVDELAEGHRGQIEELARQYGVSAEHPASHSRGLRGWIKECVKRAYSAGLIAGTALVGFVAMRFLLTLLFTQQQAPIAIRDIPTRLDVSTLAAASTGDSQNAPSNHETATRGPLAHYHQIPSWPTLNLGTNCTTSGCHAPLPHHKRIEVRAFLNMHSTYADCMVCHSHTAEQPLQVQWARPNSSSPQPTPAVLQIASLVESPIPEDGAGRQAWHNNLIKLLEQARQQTRGNAQLERWRVQLETSKPDNELWMRSVRQIQSGIGLHVHGEYDAMLHFFAGDSKFGAPGQIEERATREYLDQFANLDDSRKLALLDTIHQPVRMTGLACMTCHSPKGSLVQFERLGYPRSRSDWLRQNATINQILAIEAGQTFYLPGFLESHEPR